MPSPTPTPPRPAAHLPTPKGNVAAVYPARRRGAARPLPLIEAPRPLAGFPSPAADYIEDRLDLTDYLVDNPVATFFVKLGNSPSMIDRHLFPGDILVIDRSMEPQHGDAVLVDYAGDFMVKTLWLRRGRTVLHSENAARAADFPDILVNPELRFEICGVVTGSVRRLRARRR